MHDRNVIGMFAGLHVRFTKVHTESSLPNFPPCSLFSYSVSSHNALSNVTNGFLQLDNLVLIDKIKEQLMAEKIRPPHLPPTTLPSQQTLLVASNSDGGQHVMSIPKLQQLPGLQAHNSSQPDIALHARPASSSVSGIHTPCGSVCKYYARAHRPTVFTF